MNRGYRAQDVDKMLRLRTARPVVSTDVMGNRNMEIRPVGAWAHQEPQLAEVQQRYEAVRAAEEEEQKRQQLKEIKEERLANFQKELKKRVSVKEREKRQKEEEQDVRCLGMQKNVLHQCAEVNKSSNVFHRSAFVNQCPHLTFCSTKQRNQKCIKNGPISSEIDKNRLPNEVCTEMTGRENWSGEYSHDQNSSNMFSQTCSDLDSTGQAIKQIEDHNLVRVVINDFLPERIHRVCRDSYRSKEEEKLQQQMQRVISRRLFMDMEREQAKEVDRQRQHKLKILMLKSEKEAQRCEEEARIRAEIEPKDPMTGETLADVRLREFQKQQQAKNNYDICLKRMQKSQEYERYLEALRKSLQEKTEKRGVLPPPLCCCGVTLWDTHPDTCANNCVFYKNPKGYARALKSVIASMEVNPVSSFY